MSEQQGWRLCRKCLSSCYGGLPGVCVTGGQHDFQGSRWYAIPSAAPSGVQSQSGWRWCRKCQVLFHPGEGPGACPAGGVHEHPEGNSYILACTPYSAGGQEGFRYCNKCRAMHLPGSSPGPCPAGGVHNTSPSLQYSMHLGAPQGTSTPPAQPGWRRCRKCRSSCFGGIPGACASGGLHDFRGSAWYGMPVEAPSGGNSQDGWRYCKKCQVLFHPGEGPGFCPSGGGHEQEPTGINYRLAFSPYVTDGQEGWRYCGKCHAMYLRDGSAGTCPGGGEHTDTSSLPYSMLLQVPLASVLRPSQPGWRRCRKCQASCFGGMPGVCASGGRHDFGDSAWYALPTEPPFGVYHQGNWRWCKKCQVLFHPGLGAGSCPAGGGHEQDPTGCDYQLAVAPYPTDGQEGWRYCSKCHVMHLPGATAGTCAAGGVHTDSPSAPYSMLLATPIRAANQSGWRRCRKCKASCYAALPGVCVSGGQHDFEGSAWYSLATAAPTDGNYQEGWRWCKKCQVLFHPGLGVGVCPAGGGHEHPPGNPYHLAAAPYASSGQEGWRYCGNCHALHLPDGSAGPCPAGGQHITAPSIPYSLRLQNQMEVQCKLITDYDANQQPQSRFEVVLIPRGADGSLLPDTVVKVLASSPVNIIREERGTFTTEGLDLGTPLSFTTSMIGRVRFTIIPPQDKLSLPSLFAQSAAMGADQWAEFSPDDELHTQLAGLTGDKLTTAPTGKAFPLLPSSRAADAAALATGVSRVMTRFNPQAPTGKTAVSFGFWNDISDGLESAGSAIAGGVTSAIDAAAAAAQKATDVGSSLYNTIASQTSVAADSAARYLDTVGSGAQLLIQNSSSALLVPADHFVTKSIASATQLAIDVGAEVTVFALEAVDGARRLVKFVVQNVEAAAMIAAEFIKRVGLTIKMVIEFLAALHDWGAILQLQSDITDCIHEVMGSFSGTISELRPKLAGYLSELRTQLASSNTANSSQPPRMASVLSDIASVGGRFGFLADKLLSCINDTFGLPSDMGMLSLPQAPTIPLSAIEPFIQGAVSSVQASLMTLLGPGASFPPSPKALFEIITPLADGAITVLGTVADGLLQIAPATFTAIQAVFQQRLYIPVLTDFIEWVVFRGKQRLCLESLVTLLAAALLHTIRSLGTSIARGLLSFGVEDVFKDKALLMRGVAFVFGLLANFAGIVLDEGSQLKARWPKIGAVCRVLALFLSGPYWFPTASFLYAEQWTCWSCNLTAALGQLFDAFLNTDVTQSNIVYQGVSVSCGVVMIMSGFMWGQRAILLQKGDWIHALMDIAAQSFAGSRNLTPLLPPASQPKPVAALAGCGGAVTVGQIIHAIVNPSATLG